MIIFNKMKDEEKFLAKIIALTPEKFIALAKVFEVKLSVIDPETKAYSLRDAEEILEECVNIFRKLKHKERKLILKAMEK